MRYGLLLGAALIGCAGQAGAEPFLRFTLTGHGNERFYGINSDPFGSAREGDFVLTFAIDAGINPEFGSGKPYISDGSSFVMPFGPHTFYAYVNPGSFSVLERGTDVKFSETSTADFSLPAGVQSFDQVQSGPATGNVNYMVQTGYFSRYFTGKITNVSVAAASGIEGFALVVPEPTTWFAMVVGFGAIGAAMRRRQVAVRLA